MLSRRNFVRLVAGALVLTPPLVGLAQVPGWKICHKEGHLKGSKTYTTDYPVNGYPGCTKTLHSTKCPRCNSDWTFKVTFSGVCPKQDDDDAC